MTEGGETPATRFFEAFDQTRELLRQYPEIGSLRSWISDRFRAVRVLPVKGGFGNILVVYEPAEDGAYILRVIRGARDLQTIFSESD